LEYAASVWDPNLAKDINKLENIQKRSARFVKGSSSVKYPAMGADHPLPPETIA